MNCSVFWWSWNRIRPPRKRTRKPLTPFWKGLAKKDLSKISHIKKNQVINDLEKESEDNLKRVGKTFAGVEIVHFCANDNCRPLWEKLGIGQKPGTVVFWHFLIPKICELRKIAGCEYLFLFATDYPPLTNCW